ncbi:MAG: dihydrodipicolinate synthase family protein, partial [Gemmatimonadota bacterium]
VGELWDLSEAEHLQVVRVASAQVAGRAAVYAGICGGTEASVERARQVEAAGAHGVLLFPDDDAVPDVSSLLDYYTRVSRAVSIGLMPFRADAAVDLAVLDQLAALPNVVALKEEREHMDDFREIVRAMGDRLVIVGAGDAFAPCYFVLGGGGLACGLSNFLPALYVEMWEASRRWDYRRVMEIHASLEPFTGLRRQYGSALLKAALEELGLAGGPCRVEPHRMAAADRAELVRLLAPFRATAGRRP